MKKVYLLILLFIIAFLIREFFFLPENNIGKIQNEIKNFASSTMPSFESVFTSSPLKSKKDIQGKTLTVSGVIEWTNKNRKTVLNLPPLKENTLLNLAAQNKLNDMFSKQYFEHQSPDGKGPADLAKNVGYEYIVIGENLALGNFENDEDLVTAWMNSPGHRANILKSNLQEIGVAVGQGVYEGKKVWIAVQEFAKPASACASANSNTKLRIESLELEISTLQNQLTQTKQELDSQNPNSKEEADAYNKIVNDYNNLVKIFNNKVDEIKLLTDQYNAQVNNFNLCASQ